MQKLETEFLQSGGEFTRKRIGEIFTIGTGSLIDSNELIKGKVKRISVKSDNNGIIGEFDTENLANARHFENFISVNFFGGVFYHPYKASVEMKVHTLKIQNIEFTKETGLYLTGLLSKALRGLFAYGNQLSSSLLKNGEFYIDLPMRYDKIDFEYMRSYVAEIQKAQLAEILLYLKASNLSNYDLTINEEVVLHEDKEWQLFNLKNLFGSATRGKRLKSLDRKIGNLPFVTAGEANAGISAFIDNDTQVFKKNTITIDMFGSAKYRNYDYGADDHVAVIGTQHLEKHSVIFIASAIHKVANAGQFSYSRNFYAKDADELNILLPIKNNQPDYDYMETYIKAVQKLVIKDVVDFAERELKAYQQVTGKN